MRRLVLLPAMLGLLLLLPSAGHATCIDYEDYLHFQHAEPFTNSNPVLEMDRHGDMLVVCRGSGGVGFVDVSDPYAPASVGKCSVFGSAENAMWYPPYVFVADSDQYVTTVDASDPANPFVCGGAVTSGAPYCVTRTREVLIAGTEFGIDIFRFGSPCAPTLMDSVSMHGPVYDVMMGLEDQYAFCAMGTDGLGVVEVDTTSGSTLLTVEPTDHEFRDLVVRDHYVFVTRIDGWDAWLDVYDVITPSSPSYVTSVELSRPPEDIAYADLRFWLAHNWGVDVVSMDGTGYENPVFERLIATYGKGKAVCLGPDALMVASREHTSESDWAGVECFDLGNLEMVQPEVTASVSVPTDAVGMGPYVLVAAWSSSLHVFDCATNTFVAGEYIDSEPMCVALNGSDDAIVSTYWSKAYHVDMSDPLDPVRGSVGDAHFGSLDLDCCGGRAYQSANWTGVHVLDVSSPDTVSTVGETFIDDAKVIAVDATEGYCYAAGANSDLSECMLWVLDTSDPDTAVVVGSWTGDGAGQMNDVKIVDDVAYLCGWERMYIVDVSNPMAPVSVGSTRLPGKMWNVAVGVGYAYVAGESGDYFVVDVSDPADPRVVGEYCYPRHYGNALGLCAWGESIYVLGDDELLVFGRHCSDATGVSTPDEAVGPRSRLVCAPNPFTRSTEIAFTLPEAGRVRLAVYDVAGRMVSSVVDAWRPAGAFSASWDGRDASGREVATGVYFARLEVGEETVTGKVVVVR